MKSTSGVVRMGSIPERLDHSARCALPRGIGLRDVGGWRLVGEWLGRLALAGQFLPDESIQLARWSGARC